MKQNLPELIDGRCPSMELVKGRVYNYHDMVKLYPDPLISTTEISVNNLLKVYKLNLKVNLTNFSHE